MLLQFTKMHGSSNDFIVIDSYTTNINLQSQDIIKIGNRQTGIGADQILIVEPSNVKDCDFKYRIFNNDGTEVEHCGNGARCFMRYIKEKDLSNKTQIKVEVMKGSIILKLLDNGLVEVEMGKPSFDSDSVYFDASNLNTKTIQNNTLYEIKDNIWIAIASMGNPHAVQIINTDVDLYPVGNEGLWLQSHVRFKNKVNASFLQIIDDHNIKLRVYERGAGETLACGTGACASVVCAIKMGLVKSPVSVSMKGGTIKILWQGEQVIMQGDAHIVFEGSIELK